MELQAINRLLDSWQSLSRSAVTLEQRLLFAARLEQINDQQLSGQKRFSDQEIAAALAPLVAKQPTQLSQFQQFYLDDVERQRKRQIHDDEVPPPDAIKQSREEEDNKGRTYLEYLLVGAACLFLGLFGWLVGYPLAVSNLCDSSNAGKYLCPPVVDKPVTELSVQPIVPDEPVTANSTAYTEPVKVPVSLPSRMPAYRINISDLPEVQNTALRNILWVTFGFGLTGFVLPLLSRLVLKQTSSHWPTQEETLDSLTLEGLEPLHLKLEHYKLLPRLRYQEAGLPRLDVNKTVAASSQRGLLLLKYGARVRQRELVFVIPCFRLGDWRTEYFLSIAIELQERDVQVRCFYYQHSPQFVTRTPSALNSQRLSQLLTMYHGSTIVFCINAAAVFHPEFGHRLSWTDSLAGRDDRLLLSDVPMARIESDALSEVQLPLIEYSDRVGPDALMGFLAFADDYPIAKILSRSGYELPESLAHLGDPASAHQTPEPAEIKDLVRWLKSKLGRQSFELLCATAVYPDADWRLARLLAWRLMSNSENSLDESKLLNGSLTVFRRLAQLPWSRQGRYPLWLRTALVEELGAATESRVAELYRQILERSVKGQSITQYALTIDKPEQGFSAWWRYFTQATPVQDVLFVSVVSKGILGFPLPAVLSRLYRKSMMKLSHYWPSVLLGLASALLAGGLSFILFSQFTDQLKKGYLQEQSRAIYRAQNAEITVALGYQNTKADGENGSPDPENLIPAHVNGFARVLRSQGYKVVTENMSASEITQNRVSAPAEQLERLVDVLSYHTYDLPVKAVIKQNSDAEAALEPAQARPSNSLNDKEAVILLIHQVQSGQVFRDKFEQDNLISVAPSDDDNQQVTVAELSESHKEQLEALNQDDDNAGNGNRFIRPDMVVIPAGNFIMGSATGNTNERPVHQVTLPSFEIARNELTWGEWQLCEEAGGCQEVERPSFFDQIDALEQARHPVVNVNIASVNEYLNWISGQTGQSFRLPSESEWEYAARAGSTTTYTWSETIGENPANCFRCGSQWDGTSTAPVGSFNENGFGLNDTHGNVWEWTADCWHENYEGAPTNGRAWVENCTEGTRHPVRGNSWHGGGDGPKAYHSGNRLGFDAVVAFFSIGFRLARTLP